MPTGEIIKLRNVRLSFPRLFKPKAFREGQEPRFEATFLLDPSDANHAAVIEAIEASADAILDEHFNGKVPKGIKRCYGDGDEKPYDGYEGMFYISTANRTAPTVVDGGRNELKIENGVEPRIPYAGCYVNTNITLWTQDNEFGKRVNCNLRNVQFARDGAAFGVQRASADEFDELEDLGDDDDFLD